MSTKHNIDIQHCKFDDLVDVNVFTKFLDKLFVGTGIPNGLIGENGEIISQSGWVDACTLFHRQNPHSHQNCIKSNLELMSRLEEGKVAYSLCQNGLYDYATPIIVEGKRLATLFLGQVFINAPHLPFFQEQSQTFGYQQEAYMKAICSVPIVSQERIESLMELMVEMAQMLATIGLAKLRQNILEYNLSTTTKQHIQLQDILNFSPIGIGWATFEGKIEYINHQFTELFGYTLEDLHCIKRWYKKAFPNKKHRKNVLIPWYRTIKKSYQTNTALSQLETNVICQNGMQRHVLICASKINNKILFNFSDMTAHWKSEQRNRAQGTMLEMVAKGYPLADILHAIILSMEKEEPTSQCSILLLDSEKKRLNYGASLSLPQFYNDAINGVEIGMGVGSCGTAAYLGKRVIVEDIMQHEYWEPYKSLAKKAGLGACWSEPIIASNGEVLGTFAIYHARPTKPDVNDIKRISFAANLAAIAIENRHVHDKLEQQAYRDYLTELANRRFFIEKSDDELARTKRFGRHLSLIMFDIDHFKNVNDQYGHKIGDLVLKKIANICREMLREIDIIGRIGGEEFAILLPETHSSDAMEIAERLRLAIANEEIIVQGISIKISASFGVAIVSSVATSINDLLNQADIALYEAKKCGRNRVCLAS